jgi:hypothetical protein
MILDNLKNNYNNLNKLRKNWDFPWKYFCNIFKSKIKTANWEFILFEYDPYCYFLFELDLQFSGWGSYKEEKTEDNKITYYERSVLHFVILRTKFGIRKKWSKVS